MTMKGKGKGKQIAGKATADKGKRGYDDDKTGGGRKRKNPGVIQFFDDEADDIDDSDESEDSDFSDDSLEDEFETLSTMRNESSKGQSSSLPFMPKVELVDEEEYDRMMEERFKDGSRFSHFAGDDYDDKPMEPNSFHPTSREPTPTIWKVKCTVGRERLSAFCLMQKFVHLKTLGTNMKIISAFAVDHMKGFIYIEAEKQCEINEACQGIPGIYVSRVQPVPKSEVFHLFSFRSKNPEISVGMWARVKSGNYKGDLGQVMAVNDTRTKVTVKLIPRIDLQALAAKFGGGYSRQKIAVSAPRLISSSELEEFRPLIQIKRDRDTGKVFEVLDGMMLKDGYVYKKVSPDSLSLWGVVPTEEEQLKFGHSENNESNDLEWLSQIYGDKKKQRVIRAEKGDGKGESSSGSGVVNGFELYDLVCFRQKDFGVIIGMDKDDTYKILKESAEGGPIAVAVEKRLIKSALLDLKLSARDHHGKTVLAEDHVRIVKGPSEGKQGIVKHIYRGIIFLYDGSEEENGGYFTAKANMCEKIKLAIGGGKDSEPGPLVFDDQPSSPRSPLSPEKPWQARENNREFNNGDKDSLFTIGQTLRIRIGPLKGYLCRVTGIRRSDVTVKLDSQQKFLTVKCEHLSEVQGKSTAKPTSGDPDSSLSKPFDFLGTEGSSGGWMDAAGTSTGGGGWNVGGGGSSTGGAGWNVGGTAAEATEGGGWNAGGGGGTTTEGGGWNAGAGGGTATEGGGWNAGGGGGTTIEGGGWNATAGGGGGTTTEGGGWNATAGGGGTSTADGKWNAGGSGSPTGGSAWNVGGTSTEAAGGGGWKTGGTSAETTEGGGWNAGGGGKSTGGNGWNVGGKSTETTEGGGWNAGGGGDTTTAGGGWNATAGGGGTSTADGKWNAGGTSTEAAGGGGWKTGGTSAETTEGGGWNAGGGGKSTGGNGWNVRGKSTETTEGGGWNAGGGGDTTTEGGGWNATAGGGGTSTADGKWNAGGSGSSTGGGAWNAGGTSTEAAGGGGWKTGGTSAETTEGGGWNAGGGGKSTEGNGWNVGGKTTETIEGGGKSTGGNGWNVGGKPTETTEGGGWKTGGMSAERGNDPIGCPTVTGTEDAAWDTKKTSTQKSSWGAAVENKVITSDPDKSGGWGSSAGLISGLSEGAKEDSNWGKIKSGSITVPEIQNSEGEKGGNWNSVSQNACVSQGDGWAQKSNWKSGSTNDSIVKKSDSLSWGEGTLKNENQNSNWSSVGPSVATPDTDWGKKTEWNSGNGGSQPSEVNNSNWNSGSGDSNQTSSWGKNSNWNSNNSSGSALNDNKNSNWSSGNPDPQTQDSDWGKKSNWNSGSGGSNQSTTWKSNGNWSTGSGDNLGGANDGLNETSEDGGGGGWRGGYRGRGGSDRGGFRGRGFRGRGERGGGERGGGFGGRGGRGGRGRSDREGFAGRWGSDREFGGRGRGRVDQSGEDGSFDGKKGGWNQGASSNTTSWGQSNASSWNESGDGSWGKKNDASDKGGW